MTVTGNAGSSLLRCADQRKIGLIGQSSMRGVSVLTSDTSPLNVARRRLARRLLDRRARTTRLTRTMRARHRQGPRRDVQTRQRARRRMIQDRNPLLDAEAKDREPALPAFVKSYIMSLLPSTARRRTTWRQDNPRAGTARSLGHGRVRRRLRSAQPVPARRLHLPPASAHAAQVGHVQSRYRGSSSARS